MILSTNYLILEFLRFCYGSEACGYNKFNKCDQIQYQTMRFFLGIHKYAPIIGLQGEIV